MAHEHNDQCRDIRRALDELRAERSRERPRGVSAYPNYVGGVVGGVFPPHNAPGDQAPEAQPAGDERIAHLEQALRDVGCER